ncbi:class I SAM-dependent methyltransferase [Clostridium sp. 19966]|uniref:tRNA (mnm(5)s(2)U34)-methyltransferase n=1 Tax=Clostridium sp. 19966 TaxID=2768166 RepID=UPI0028E04888|nr:class I SAM-dependent methyltransferase [Clostridium sp. 19966]MDT8716381.1 class I SAM-dependent methyltransferase [Clostridium sp. 19966]
MFNYVNDVSTLSHYIIKNFCTNFETAIDATLGNGHDSDFLSTLFKKTYAFDIQEICINNYKNKFNNNVELILDSHANILAYVKEPIDCAVFNLGFLPGGNKNITTNYSSTVKGVKTALELLNRNGIITVAIYSGHHEGIIERQALINFLETLPKNLYGVMLHSVLNRYNSPPELIVIEKK